MTTYNGKEVKSVAFANSQPDGVADKDKFIEVAIVGGTNLPIVKYSQLQSLSSSLASQIASATARKAEIDALIAYIGTQLSIS